MRTPPIIIIINKKPYVVNKDKIETIRAIPQVDRQQLIALLEVLKSEEGLVQSIDQPVVASITSIADAEEAVVTMNAKPESQVNVSGDVEAVMAQLILEEDFKKKDDLSTQFVYKWAIAGVVIFFLLILIF